MNMSAKILRNIVAATFKVDAKSVVLSGQISADWTRCSNTCWSSQTTKETHKLWGFNSIKGFVALTDECVSKGHNHSDGTWTSTNSPKFVGELSKVHNIEDYIFFVYRSVGNAYHDESQSWDNWSLYKAPNFREHWDKVNSADIARWEQWLVK